MSTVLKADLRNSLDMDREPDDWKCVNGHDRCYGGTSAGPECPYCEPIYSSQQDQEDIAQENDLGDVIRDVVAARYRLNGFAWDEKAASDWAHLLREIGNLQRTARVIVQG